MRTIAGCCRGLTHAALPLLPLLGSAEINSGGGISSGGTFSNHTSIGSAFATPVTKTSMTRNHSGLMEVMYPVTSSSVLDINKNGLPDGWEVQYYGVLGVNPVSDSDSDGTNNLMEYLAGTNPINSSSLFRPLGTYDAGVFKMPVKTISGRNYLIWVSRNLKSWTLQSTLIGNDTVQIFKFDEKTINSGPLQSTVHPSNYYFRVQIAIPETP